MISLKRKNSILLAVLLGSTSTFAADEAKQSAEECSKTWASEGKMKSKSIVYGVGVSSKPNKLHAAEESKSQAYREISTQLQASVSSESQLKETESGATYSGNVNVASNGKDLVGIRIIKEGSNAASGITHCSVAQFDVGSAYSESEGQMNVLEKQLKSVFDAAKSKKYIEVLQKRAKAHELVKGSSDQIARADMFRMFLKADDQSWYEKIKGKLADVDEVAEEAKSQIAFILPANSEYEGTISDVESKLSGIGFNVARDNKVKNPVKLSLELKQIGAPRKTKTALGETYISRINVSLKDHTGKTIATNKGVQVTGTGQTEDDAIANIDRQLLVHVLGVLNEGLPGLIPDSEQ